MISLANQLAEFLDPENVEIGRKCRTNILSNYDIPKQIVAVTAANLIDHGIRILRVSEAECDLYAQTDLDAVDPQEWKQSYPTIIIQFPQSVHPCLVAVTHCLFDVTLTECVITEWFKTVRISAHFEEAFASPEPSNIFNIDAPSIDTRIGRIAINAILHLANYNDLYTAYHDRQSRQLFRAKPKSFLDKPKRLELIPQVIRLREPMVIESEGDPHQTDSTGSSKRPHWRRGHWRRARVGTGRTETKMIFIKPMLIHGNSVIGSKSQSTVFEMA